MIEGNFCLKINCATYIGRRDFSQNDESQWKDATASHEHRKRQRNDRNELDKIGNISIIVLDGYRHSPENDVADGDASSGTDDELLPADSVDQKR